MKSVFSKLMASLLAMVLLFNCSTQALAAPSRNTGTVKYLSEVAVIEAENQEEADAILAQLQEEANGSFTGMVSVDLNKGGKPVFLAYKTSTNVDDAITDLAVMNMAGNYSMGNYEQLLDDTMEGYKEVTNDYRVIAKAFAEAYHSGNRNAQIAYRQMNYYYMTRGTNKIYMGDFMLDFPSLNEEFAEILFYGNLYVIANLRNLMAMGVGNSEVSLAERIAQSYANAETDPSVYENAAYERAAESMKDELKEMKDNVNNLEAEIEALESQGLEESALNVSKSALQMTLDNSLAFLELLKEIPKGDTTLGDFIMDSPVIETKDLFPIVAAGEEAEAMLMKYRSFYALLLYDRLEESNEVMEAALEELEEDLEPISVYHGVQNDMYAGTIGVTDEAETVSNSTGKNFLDIYTGGDQGWAILFSALGVAGLASTLCGTGFLYAKLSAIAADQAAMNSALETAQANLEMAEESLTGFNANPANAQNLQDLQDLTEAVNNANEEVSICLDGVNQANSVHLKAGQVFAGSAMIVLGVAAMAVSIWQLAELYNKYEPEYTEIPNNMVSVVEGTEGDRFVNYINVPAYYLKDGVLNSRENDLNSYDGAQWVSLYYTKSYEAGYCLTASPDLVAEEEAKSGYSPIHLFGRSDSYNTNAYCNREDAEAVYLAFKYSTNQKSAVTDIPDLVGSAFSFGMVAVAGFVGLGLGMAIMALISRRKKTPAAQ